MFEQHLLNVHGFKSIRNAYVQIKLGGIDPKCACNICEQEPKFLGWNHGFAQYVNGHNGRIYTSYDADKAKQISEKRAEKIRGKSSWSAGIKKEDDIRLKVAADKRSKKMKILFSTGQLSSWSCGLNKDTDTRIAKSAANLKEKFKSGALIPWSRGLSKETDERIYNMSLNVSNAHRQKELRNQLDSIKKLSPEVIMDRLQKNVHSLELLTNLADYEKDKKINLKFVCKVCKKEQNKSLIQALSDRCDYCSPMGSKAQRELYAYALSIDPNSKTNDRTLIPPQEIDVTLHSHQIGLEFNGLYFHSEIFKSKWYHDDKSLDANAAGWRLFHVWEDEWRDKKEIVKSMIKHRCNLNKAVTSARNCKIVKISARDRSSFFNANHIDGDAKASISWGLLDPKRNKIIAAISIRKPMHKKWKSSLEIARFCTIINESVPGSVGKLLNVAEQYSKNLGYDSIITYVDGRFGSMFTAGYEKTGYKMINQTPPRFWWTDGRQRIDRFKVRADKDSGLSEKQVADSLGVVKIWGCRNLLYRKII